jgi:hypothetical protein
VADPVATQSADSWLKVGYGIFRRLTGLNLKFAVDLIYVSVRPRAGAQTRMAIYRLLQNSPLGPEEIAVLTDAYERTLRKLRLVDRTDPITEMIAKKVIEMAQRGVREAQQISDMTISELGVE